MSINRKVRDTARAEKMAAMYRQCVTLQKIGDQFEVSRERVRQWVCRRCAEVRS